MLATNARCQPCVRVHAHALPPLCAKPRVWSACVCTQMHAKPKYTVLYARCCSRNLNVATRNPVLFRLLFTLLYSRSPSSLLSASLSLSLSPDLSSLRNLFSPLYRAPLSSHGELVLYSGMLKITLFLYNAHIHRSYCNLVRSRFRVIGGKKYFHGCGTPAAEAKKKERERVVRPRGNLLGRKSRAAINSPLKRNRSGTF